MAKLKTKYSFEKIIKFPQKIHSLLNNNEMLLPPIHVRIKPINLCNHDCHYCSYRTSNLGLGKNMNEKDMIPQKKFLEIIDDLERFGVQAITLSGGGEPLLYPGIETVLERLARGKMKYAVITNGSLLSGERAKIIASSASWVRVSIDGWSGESYAKYRAVRSDEFDKVLKNMKSFSMIKNNCSLGASIIVDHVNVEHLEKLIKDLIDTGVDSIKISPCVISDDVKKSRDYVEQFWDVASKQVDDFSQKYPAVEIFNSFKTGVTNESKEYTWCPYLQILPVIGADLNVYSCQDKAYTDKGKIGDIKDQKFSTFWLNGKSKFYEINPKKDCSHHCVADEKNKLVLSILAAPEGHDSFV